MKPWMELQLNTILILVADKVPIELLRALNQDGYQVWVATNGAEALDRYRSFRPDLIIVDVPRLGTSRMAAMRLIYEAAPTPIIALGSAEAEIESLDTGAAHFITKPVAVSEIQARVRALLRRASSKPRYITPQGQRTFWPRTRPSLW